MTSLNYILWVTTTTEGLSAGKWQGPIALGQNWALMERSNSGDQEEAASVFQVQGHWNEVKRTGAAEKGTNWKDIQEGGLTGLGN